MKHLGLKHKFHILCFWEFQAEWVWEKVSKSVKELTTELIKTNCSDNCPACIQLPLLNPDSWQN